MFSFIVFKRIIFNFKVLNRVASKYMWSDSIGERQADNQEVNNVLAYTGVTAQERGRRQKQKVAWWCCAVRDRVNVLYVTIVMLVYYDLYIRI